MRQIAATAFATGRHFNNPTFAGTRVIGLSVGELEKLANDAIESGVVLMDGYASFCKHLFIPNHGETKAGVACVTTENAHLLRSGYEARREGELPVLTRWLEGLEAPRAEWLDLILYSREQLEEEDNEKPVADRDVPDAKWGIVSINAELQPSESPMPPITMMRNALGKSEGGSGVTLNREAYARSVEFWKNHASVRQLPNLVA